MARGPRGRGGDEGTRDTGADATGVPDTGGIRGFSPDRQADYPVAGGAVDAADRAADEEEAASDAHDPLGPSGYVEERDITGGPATLFADRVSDPSHEPDYPGDLVVEGPDAGPVLTVLPPRAGEEGEEEGEDLFPEVNPRGTDVAGSRWLLPFASALHHTREWMRDVSFALGSNDPRDARHALHAVLATLRDQLPVAEIADLSASLPLPLRGILLEGWTGQPVKVDTRVAFLAALERRLGDRARVDPEIALRAVMEVLRRRVPEGEMAHLEAVLPADLKWVTEPA